MNVQVHEYVFFGFNIPFARSQGQYELEDVVKGVITVDRRDFYYMTYTQIFNEETAGYPLNIDARFYLSFADDFNQSGRLFQILVTESYLRDQPQIDGLTEEEINDFLTNITFNWDQHLNE